MKQLEDLARLRVNEALKNGIRSQHFHRMLSENGDKTTPAVRVKAADSSQVNQPRQIFAVLVLRTILLKIIGLFGF